MSYGMNNSQSKMKERVPKGFEKATLNNFTPEQNQLLQQRISELGPDSYLAKLAGGDQSQFAEMEAPALRQFGEMQNNIASRFSGQGMGSRRSSSFQNQMYSSSSDFAQQLQGQRMGLRNQAIRDLMDMSNQLMGQRPQSTSLVEKPQKQSSGWGGVAGAVGGGALGFFGSGGNPYMAVKGAQIGQTVGSAF